MNAEPVLTLVAALLAKHRLEAVLIGNAAAALQGSPVTTANLDFMFRKTPRNLAKLRAIADDLDAMILRPFYPSSGLYRIVRDTDGLQLDFMSMVDGVRSFESLRGKATVARFAHHELRVAALADIIRSKPRLAGRRIERCSPSSGRRSVKRAKPPRRRKSALRRESDRGLILQIRRMLALPMEKRTNFLRRRLAFGGSHI